MEKSITYSPNHPSQAMRRGRIFDQVRFNRDDIMYHALFWFVLYILHFINFAYTDIDKNVNYHDAIITANLTFITTSIAAYIHTYWLLPLTLGNPKINSIIGLATYLTVSIFLVLGSSWLFELLYKTKVFGELKPIVDTFGNVISPKEMSWIRNLPESFFNMYLLTGLVYVRKWFYNSEEMRLRNKLLEKENEVLLHKKEVETYKMQRLDWQIKPHFLFNSLNNIYIKILKTPTVAADVVLQLGDAMRYIVYDCQDEKIPLSKEVEFLKNYVDLSLQGLPENSYSKKVTFGLFADDIEIMPLILIPFVENAIKHGIQKTDENKWFTLDLSVKNKELIFILRNSQNTEQLNHAKRIGGVGIANTRQRLKLGYPNRHSLSLNSEGNVFETILKIQL
ncbi:MAG: histidine kinase [Saprospiraceae bacterium]|nr:histidine kinase [Saprospiraceae bacterium]